MSAVGKRTRPTAAWPVLAAGVLALSLRLRVLALPQGQRIAMLILIYGALLAGSLLPAKARGRDPTLGRTFGVLAAGLAGVGAATLAAGRPAAVPFGPWVLPLSMLAAVAEEAFFRRAVYGAIERRAGAGAAALGAAVAFAAIHVPLYGVAAFPADLGAGLLLGWQRWETGDWTVPAATHAAANLLAVISR